MMHLLRKELRELLNKQMLLSLLVTFLLIAMIGFVMTNTMNETLSESGQVHLLDADDSDASRALVKTLEERGYTVSREVISEEPDYAQLLASLDWSEAAMLPKGYGQALSEGEACEIGSITMLRTTSALSLTMAAGGSAEIVRSAVQAAYKQAYLTGDLAFMQDPVTTSGYTVANGKWVQADAMSVASSLTMFDQVMPLILFLLVILTVQTIITAVATEKTDKTLETLLSSPMPRSTIIIAKMLAALIVAVIYAVTYGVAFVLTLFGTVSDTASQVDIGGTFESILDTRAAAQTLGLQIPAAGWLGVVMQLVLTIGIALTASIILGGLVEDAKGSQTASLPILVCTMFPYLFSMLSDIRSMEGVPRILMLCIPFTHTFIATSCMRFHDMPLFWFGLAYQAVFLGVMIFAAVRLYQSDLLFVHSRKYRKRKIHAD